MINLFRSVSMKKLHAFLIALSLVAVACSGGGDPTAAPAAEPETAAEEEQNNSQPVPSTTISPEDLEQADLDGIAEPTDELVDLIEEPPADVDEPATATTVPEEVQERAEELSAEVLSTPVETVEEGLRITINELQESGLDVGGRWSAAELVDLGARYCAALVLETELTGLTNAAVNVAQQWPSLGEASIEDVVAVTPQLSQRFCPQEMDRIFNGG